MPRETEVPWMNKAVYISDNSSRRPEEIICTGIYRYARHLYVIVLEECNKHPDYALYVGNDGANTRHMRHGFPNKRPV